MISAICYYMMWLITSWFNVYGFTGRGYWLKILVCLSLLSLYYVIESRFLSEIVFVGLLTIITYYSLKETQSFVYGDYPIDKLTTKIESGIWKGCYTSQQKANDVVELEQTVKRITKKEDRVLFLDWVSFAYLMTDAIPFTPTTLDPSTYSYNVNDPKIMYEYFSKEKYVPDKIIYIDYGRDKKCSIGQSDWKFNIFVNAFYKKDEKEIFSNQTFKLEIYNLFDNEGAIQYAFQNRE